MGGLLGRLAARLVGFHQRGEGHAAIDVGHDLEGLARVQPDQPRFESLGDLGRDGTGGRRRVRLASQ